MIKIYRTIDPISRQAREVQALRAAPGMGIHVPRMLTYGQHRDLAWIALHLVPGRPLTLHTPAEAQRFAATAHALADRLHRQPAQGAGHGWRAPARQSTSDFLASQLSHRLRAHPGWHRLRQQLSTLDSLPTVLLHGDLKPEHMLTGPNGTFLVDWEACARGPAVLDQGDIAFRIAREVAYSELPKGSVARILTVSPLLSIAIAWRLARWLDRRHDKLNDSLETIFSEVLNLTISNTPEHDVETIAEQASIAGTRY